MLIGCLLCSLWDISLLSSIPTRNWCRRQTVIPRCFPLPPPLTLVAYWLLELINALINALSLKSFKITARHPRIHKLLIFFRFHPHHFSAATPEILAITSLLFCLFSSHHSFQSAEARAQKRQHPRFFYLLSDTTICESILYLLYPILILKTFLALSNRQLNIIVLYTMYTYTIKELNVYYNLILQGSNTVIKIRWYLESGDEDL